MLVAPKGSLVVDDEDDFCVNVNLEIIEPVKRAHTIDLNVPLAFRIYFICPIFKRVQCALFFAPPSMWRLSLESLSFADQHGTDEMEIMKVIFTRYAFDNDYQIWVVQLFAFGQNLLF